MPTTRFRSACLSIAAAVLGGCAAEPTPMAPAVAPRAGGATLAAWEPVGRSVQGRPIEAITLPGPGPRVLIVGGIHGDEPEGLRAIDAVAAYVAALRSGAAVRIVRDANPDGTASGSRANARGVDLNRNWPARNFSPSPERGGQPLSEPETRALHREIERFAPDLVLVCHSSARGPFVNFDGPGAEPAAAFATGAARADARWRIVPDMGYPTPGSLGSFLGVDRRVPILTIEFARGDDEARAWAAMRDGLGAVLEHCRSHALGAASD